MKKKNLLSLVLMGVVALVLALSQVTGLTNETAQTSGTAAVSAQAENDAALSARSGKKATATPRAGKATATPRAAKATAAPDAVTPTPVPDGPIIDPQSIADYLFANGCLPDNFLTKREAQDLGWDSSYNDVSDVAPGKSIGGDVFGNYEGLLPRAKGRTYYECDCYYTTGNRGPYRIIYSSDGLVYYTEDHYKSFEQMFPSTGT